MDFAELQTEVKDMLNFTDAADQDFTAAQVKNAINLAYRREVARAKQHGSRDWFKAYTELTWAASTVTLALPSNLFGRTLIRFEDVTDSDPGVELLFSDDGSSGEIFFKDADTLQWGSAGPTSERTLRVTFYTTAELLVSDSDTPRLVPAELHELLVWSASCYLREKADEAAPQGWYGELGECRLDYWKYVSRGRPAVGNETTVTHTGGDLTSFVY